MTQESALAPDVLHDAQERARELIRGGFQEPDEIVESLVDFLEDQGLTEEQAEQIVVPLWEERLAEQAGWPAVTDVDRLVEAFDSLEADGIVAAMDFTCCSSCGYAEIGGEADEDSRGFVFFHEQDTERAVAGGGLTLRYGGFRHSEEETAEVGRDVVAALAEAGLNARWTGSPDETITVTPLNWLHRLPE
ncbi:hypothetical protein GCM10010495_68570 [Kitasatospora herbaricolor]|uniref:DUF6891 domain-containing protein n=1 Tax=Kitasatospora herbaricolor TaxID=68217 RepID=UPI001748A4B4|nr:hypothetical protein [Kitasatospora herbaricolor]MDQ0307930.1 hypothetical protein [Kitasatospora herbaricolor]GGV41311.1 hypothetical protein GCM10010495_68570 [Kitasatospora herbaricolor]